MPNDNKQVKSEDNQLTPSFWAFHPVGRGIGTGALCDFFSTATSFKTGFIYGAMAGGFNVVVRSAIQPTRKETTPETKAVKYLTTVASPWVASAGVMHQLAKISRNSLFHIKPSVAIASAIAVECLGYANKDLLRK